MPASSSARKLACGYSHALVVALVLLVIVGSAPARVLAASLVVTTIVDEQNTNGACSLREAIINANNDNQSGSTDCAAGSGADQITFAVTGPIVLGSPLPDILGNLTITGPGPGASALTISGNNAVRVLKVAAGAQLTLNTLSVSNGLVTNDYGGGIRNHGTLAVNNSRIVNNISAGTSCCSGGGGLSSDGVLTVTNSIISGNQSSWGGGINVNSQFTMTNSQVSGNSASEIGGGVFVYTGGHATINGGEIFSNTAPGTTSGNGGGGIYNADTLTLDGVNIHGNTSARVGGGILNNGGLAVMRSTLSANSASSGGAALYTTGNLTLTNSTVMSNTSGIIVYLASGTHQLSNSTVSDNSGDAIYTNSSSATLVNVTVYQNTGSGLVNSMFMKNTIIANNGGGNCLFANTGFTQGFNLSNDTSCLLNGTGDQQGIPAQLGPLANNGGPTLTHMPLAGSPAIDKGSGCSSLDQRGAPRVGAACDAGSVEYGSVPLTLDIDLSDTATRYSAPTDGLLLVRWMFGLTGTTLTNAALGATAARTDPLVIKAYLDSTRTLLDVDGNGTTDALTDGLLIIRYLFGLRGAELISGAVGAGATRTTSDAIGTYIQSLMP
jgi:CSLREA domain-containing protein